MPPTDRGLLARLDALVALVTDRHGSPCSPTAVWPPLRPGSPCEPPAWSARPAGAGGGWSSGTVELLRAVAEGVGLLRVRGDRLEGTSLRHAWTQIDEGLRAGLTFAAWCQQVNVNWLVDRPLTGCFAPIGTHR
jgi:hypothetical protein